MMASLVPARLSCVIDTVPQRQAALVWRCIELLSLRMISPGDTTVPQCSQAGWFESVRKLIATRPGDTAP
jgi:hypothetical protein